MKNRILQKEFLAGVIVNAPDWFIYKNLQSDTTMTESSVEELLSIEAKWKLLMAERIISLMNQEK